MSVIGVVTKKCFEDFPWGIPGPDESERTGGTCRGAGPTARTQLPVYPYRRIAADGRDRAGIQAGATPQALVRVKSDFRLRELSLGAVTEYAPQRAAFQKDH